MKVLHIGYTDSGGAGKGMMALHKALKKAGVDSRVLVANKASYDDDITCAEQNLSLYSFSKIKLIRFFQKVMKKEGWCLNQIDKYARIIKQISPSHSCFFTFPITHYDISQHPLVKEADIIHLHWISNFVDYPSFFRNVNKSIVWTLRDENPGLGGFHYETVREEYGKYYSQIEDAFLKIKHNSLMDSDNITLVAMSDIMVSFCSHNEILKSFPVKRIDNYVDLDLYKRISPSVAKSALHLEENVFSVLFVSVSLGDTRKNLRIVHDALKRIPFPTVLVCVGRNDYFYTIPNDVVCLNSIDNERLMSIVYSASDVLITPATQESFGKTTIEALSCGTPVISSKTGIAPEVINDNNGILLDEISVEAVAQAINKVKGTDYDREAISNATLAQFDSYNIVRQHMELYNDLSSGHNELS